MTGTSMHARRAAPPHQCHIGGAWCSQGSDGSQGAPCAKSSRATSYALRWQFCIVPEQLSAAVAAATSTSTSAKVVTCHHSSCESSLCPKARAGSCYVQQLTGIKPSARHMRHLVGL